MTEETKKEMMRTYEVIDFDKAAHLPIIAEWWKGHYDGEVPERCVPKHGCVVLFRGKPVASCFLYVNDTAICVMSYAMADPDLGAGNRILFVRAVVEATALKAKKLIGDDAIVWAATDNAVVARVYREKGFHCVGEADIFVQTNDMKALQFLS